MLPVLSWPRGLVPSEIGTMLVLLLNALTYSHAVYRYIHKPMNGVFSGVSGLLLFADKAHFDDTLYSFFGSAIQDPYLYWERSWCLSCFETPGISDHSSFTSLVSVLPHSALIGLKLMDMKTTRVAKETHWLQECDESVIFEKKKSGRFSFPL